MLAAAFATSAHAQSLLQPAPVPLDSLAAFKTPAANWRIAGGLAGDPRTDKVLATTDGTGVLVCNPTATARDNLFTAWEHGDLELDLEFLLPPGADSGLYLQSRYELQVRDSWGKTEMTMSDNGGIYAAWDESKPAAERATGGSAPKANASRAPGLWQHLHVEFQAPRFDATGKKTRNGRFVRVVLNGFTLHENAEVTGPTRGAPFKDEVPLGPLMIQGNNLNGQIAIRNFAVKRFDPNARLAIEQLGYQLHNGVFGKIGDYDADKPTATGMPTRFSHAAVEKNGKFALVLTGSLNVTRPGEYAFSPETGDPVRLLIDGRPVVTPLERGGQAGKISLTAGAHPVRLDVVHSGNNRLALDIIAEGPGLAPQSLGGSDASTGARRTFANVGPKKILLEPADGRVRMQRGFVPFEPKKRLYATSVGTPAGVHYAYDLETGSLLRVWRGAWLDAGEMWEGRGEPQLAKATGPSLTFSAKPTVAFIENPRTAGWPETPDAMQSSQGYTLETNGQPVFLSTLSGITIRDRIAPTADGKALTRRLDFKGTLPSWEAQVLLAEADVISPQPGGGWVIGEREYYIDWPADSPHQPSLSKRGDKQLLVVRLSKATLEAPLSYSLVW